MRERKELGVGLMPGLAKRSMDIPFDEARHEVVHDDQTGLFQVFRKRRDRTVKKSIRREGTEPYSYGKDAKPIVLIVHPREMLETRLKGRRKGHSISWHDLHTYLVRRDALAAIAQKKRERKARR